MNSMQWTDRLSLRTKLLIVSISSVVLVAGIGGAWMMWTAKATLAHEIDGDLQRSAELMTSLVRRTSEADVQSYLLGIAEKNVELLSMFQRRVEAGELTLEEAKRRGRDILLAQHIGDTGYIYAVDSAGIIRVHPKAALLDVDLSKYSIIQRQKREKAGDIEYVWANPGETATRPKALSMAYFPAWDWIVSVSSYRSEFDKLLNVEDLSKSILSIHFGETGYAFVITETGQLIIHPKLAGQNIFDSVDHRGRYFIRDMCQQKEGQIYYFWKNPGETAAREKLVVFRSLPDRKWIVATSIYVDDLYRPLERLRMSMWATALGVLGLLVLALWATGTAIARPLRSLMARIGTMCEELGLGVGPAGTDGTPTKTMTRDEMKLLTVRFDAMATAVRLRDHQLTEHRQNLENLVAQRTRELSTRNEEMQLVLDTIDQGLAIVDLSGRVGSERSAMFHQWFGPASDPQSPFYEILVPRGSNLSQYFRFAWDAVVEDILPLELNLEQMPKTLERDGRHYALAYRPILGENSALSKVLFIVSDVTAEVAQLAHDAEQKEFLAVFERVMKDRVGFIEFFNDASKLTDELSLRPPADDVTLSRRVHTLKGNAGVFGLKSIADVCHSLEQRASEAGVAAMREALPLLVGRWTDFARKVVPLIGTQTDDVVEVHFGELENIADAVRKSMPAADILDAIDRLKAEPAHIRFERIAEQARGIAERLGKGPVDIEIQAGDVRLPLERWGDFWSAFVHVVRNALDHGLETREQRDKVGKRVPARLVLSAEEQDAYFLIALRDDGRGIDWGAIRERARAVHLPSTTREDLVEALFADGVSTKPEVTDLSGRGVGMGAVRDATRKLGGSIEIDTVSGKGTTFRFRIPVEGNRFAPPGSKYPGARPTLQPPTSMRVTDPPGC